MWGGKSKAKIIIEMIKENHGEIANVSGIFDKALKKLEFKTKLKFFNSKDELLNLIERSSHSVVCIGGEHGYARYITSNKLDKYGLKPISLISKYSVVDKPSEIGDGVQIMPGAVIHKFTKIGDHCIINTNSTVDHDCKVGNGVHIMGGASLSGGISIGDYSSIGTNATILPNIKIGKNVFVGAGAVVTKNIKDGQVVKGVPARFARENNVSIDLSMFD